MLAEEDFGEFLLLRMTVPAMAGELRATSVKKIRQEKLITTPDPP